jgi:4-amino-4-deoxy-L-arabinose transferase-like glycosyltransferase
VAVALFLLICAFHLGCAVAGRPIFRATYIGTALEYARGSISLLNPVIVGFNATGTPTIQEFPLWQAATAIFFKVLGTSWYGWGNVVSLLFFATCIWPFFSLAKAYVGERAAWWALVFFLAEPLIVVFAGEGSPDGLGLVLSIWFLFCADRLMKTGKAGWWFAAAIVGALAAMTKLPFFMVVGICSAFTLLYQRGRTRDWLLLGAVGAVAVAAFLVWTKHGDAMAARAEFPYVELRISESPFIKYWYFGDFAYRLSPMKWIKGGWRFLHGTLGSLPLTLVLVAGLMALGGRMPRLWLAAVAITTLVFTHLVLEHWHYYLMVCPAVALLCGLAIARWEEILGREFATAWFGPAAVGLALVLASVQGITAMHISIDLDPYAREISAQIRQNTSETDKLVLYTVDPVWGGEMLFRSGRAGLSVIELESRPGGPAPKGLRDILTNQEDLRRLKTLGYTKLVLVSQSPVRYAVEASRPGQIRTRTPYPSSIAPAVDKWPAMFRSEDLLIRQIR